MRSLVWAQLAVLVLSGCGGAEFSEPSSIELAKSELARSPKALDGALAFSSGNSARETGEPTEDSTSITAGIKEAKLVRSATRKIIYTANLSIVVDQYPSVASEIRKHLEQHQGYVAKYREDRREGASITGYWTMRVPVSRFEAFVEAVADLGIVESKQVDSQDVTEQFVDLSVRIANKKKLEIRILELLEKHEGKIQDVIAVETELGRVREEVERMEGRLRLLANQTSMTTVTLSVREERGYTPPKAPTFPSQIASSWSGSLDSLQSAGKTIALLLVAFTPWGVALSVVFLPLAIVWRRRRRQSVIV